MKNDDFESRKNKIMKYKSNFKINTLLTAIAICMLLICYLSVSGQMKADHETEQQEQAAEQQLEQDFTNIADDHATDSIRP